MVSLISLCLAFFSAMTLFLVSRRSCASWALFSLSKDLDAFFLFFYFSAATLAASSSAQRAKSTAILAGKANAACPGASLSRMPNFWPRFRRFRSISRVLRSLAFSWPKISFKIDNFAAARSGSSTSAVNALCVFLIALIWRRTARTEPGVSYWRSSSLEEGEGIVISICARIFEGSRGEIPAAANAE